MTDHLHALPHGTVLAAGWGTGDGEGPVEAVLLDKALTLPRIVNAGIGDWPLGFTPTASDELYRPCSMCHHTLLPFPEPEGFPFRRSFKGRKVCGDCHDQIVDLELDADAAGAL